jgi:hypothetical protein
MMPVYAVLSQRRDLILCILVAWALVFARNAVFIFYPHSFFDSDQAIVGLMAKHLIEGRAVPLFFYGQTYLLGVEAWVMAPFFLAGGPTVAMLHTAILAWSLAASALLIAGLVRWGGLAPWQALAASLFFTLAPPWTSALLIEANGANVEPFLYVLVLWFLRDRPIWFGLVLGIGVLNREFTIYAVPALVAIQLAQGTLFTSDRMRKWLVAAGVFVAVWLAVGALKPYADISGPGSRGRVAADGFGTTVANALDRTAMAPAEFPARIRAMFDDYFPAQIGARRHESYAAPQGREWLWWPTMIVLVAALARAAQRAWVSRGDGSRPAPAFGWYLFGIGVLAAIGYIITREVTEEPTDRYMLLVLYGPVGVMALFLALEPRVWLRRAAIVALLGWAVVPSIDHARLFSRYWAGEPDPAQALADGLDARGVRVAAANYWRAYKLTFLTRERVKISSTDVSRIDEYDLLAAREGERLIVLQPQACESDLEPINGWYLCRAGK